MWDTPVGFCLKELMYYDSVFGLNLFLCGPIVCEDEIVLKKILLIVFKLGEK